MKQLAKIALIGLITMPFHDFSQIIYASPSGSDASTGLSSSAPTTIAHALSLVTTVVSFIKN